MLQDLTDWNLFMNPYATIASILVALLVGAMSPGASFVVVARRSISLSRRDGLATAVGMGAGGVAFSCLALFGIYTLLATVSWLYIALKVTGGAYLVFLATKIWRGAKTPLVINGDEHSAHGRTGQSFWQGFATQLSNPKTAIVYGSIFAALLPHHPGQWYYLVLPPLVFGVEAGWYSFVAICLSSKGPRILYIAIKAWIDRLAGCVMTIIGLRLILTAFKPGA